MKLYFGYIFDQGIDVIRALGINEWALNEGRADKYTDYYVEEEDLPVAEKYDLSEKAAHIWYIKERLGEIDFGELGEERLKSIVYAL